MTLVTGNQLRAARALAGVDQQQLAAAADVNVNTIRSMEGRGHEPITSGVLIVRAVQTALERMGVEFLNGDAPGVRYRPVASEVTEKPTAAAPRRKPSGRTRSMPVEMEIRPQ